MTKNEIIEKARTITDLINSKWITEEEENFYYKEAFKYFYDFVVNSNAQWFKVNASLKDFNFEKKHNKTIYELPNDFYKLRSLIGYNGTSAKLFDIMPRGEIDTSKLGYRLSCDLENGEMKDHLTLYNEYENNFEDIEIEYYPTVDTIYSLNNLPKAFNGEPLAYYMAKCFLAKKDKENQQINNKYFELEQAFIKSLQTDNNKFESISNVFSKKGGFR